MKDFDGWHSIKKDIDQNTDIPLFNEREIWWCSVGVNIGYEVFGKGKIYTRPVLIVRKYSRFSFLGVPLTSKAKEETAFYHPIVFKGVSGTALLGQLRMMDGKRLAELMGKIGKKRHENIKNALKALI